MYKRRLIIPFRSPLHAKTRLATLFASEQRTALALSLFYNVLRAAAGAVGLQKITVVTADAQFAAQLSREVHAVIDDGMCVNRALDIAMDSLPDAWNTLVGIVPADLGEVSAQDIAQLFDLEDNEAAIAPDHTGLGTNGLVFPLAARFPFSFGKDSFRCHLQHVKQAGLNPRIISRRGLAYDLDTPEDISVVRRNDIHRCSILMESYE